MVVLLKLTARYMGKLLVLLIENTIQIASIFQYIIQLVLTKKLQLEGPYHNLTNGGHISYIEMDGDPTKNLTAFEKYYPCNA